MAVLEIIGTIIHKLAVSKRTPPPPSMKLTIVVGLGNPGKQYENTRHNLGFMAVDHLVSLLQETNHCSDWKEHNKAPVLYAEHIQDDHKIIFAKPLSYMNDSGQPVRKLLDFYKATPDNLIIIHDELDLPAGDVRIVEEASAGGHNGLKSIFNHLGTQKVKRLRIGIKNKKLEKIPTEKFVLMPFGLLEKQKIKSKMNKYGEIITCMIFQDTQSCMNKYN